MSSAGAAPEDSKDKALEVLAIYLSDDELTDFNNYNMQGGSGCSSSGNPEDRKRFMALTNMHQHALYQLGLAIMDSEVEGEGALEVFTDMLAMTGEALRQLRQDSDACCEPEEEAEQPPPQEDDDDPEVGGGSPRGRI